MTTQIKLQMVILTAVTFLAGTAFGLYIASQMIGQWMPELSK